MVPNDKEQLVYEGAVLECNKGNGQIVFRKPPLIRSALADANTALGNDSQGFSTSTKLQMMNTDTHISCFDTSGMRCAAEAGFIRNCKLEPNSEWDNVDGVQHTTRPVSATQFIEKYEEAREKVNSYIGLCSLATSNFPAAYSISRMKIPEKAISSNATYEECVALIDELKEVTDIAISVCSLKPDTSEGYREIQQVLSDLRVAALQYKEDLEREYPSSVPLTMKAELVCKLHGAVMSIVDEPEINDEGEIEEEVSTDEGSIFKYFFRGDDARFIRGWKMWYCIYSDDNYYDHNGVDVVVRNSKTSQLYPYNGEAIEPYVNIYSVCNGTVLMTSELEGRSPHIECGYWIAIKSIEPILCTVNGETKERILTFRYLHMREPAPDTLQQIGTSVSTETVLGQVGHTGSSTHAHLHFDANAANVHFPTKDSILVDPRELFSNIGINLIIIEENKTSELDVYGFNEQD